MMEKGEVLKIEDAIATKLVSQVVKPTESRTLRSIESGLKEIKEIVAGKKKGKTLRQLLDEV